MSVLDAAVSAAVEFLTYVSSRVLGRTLNIDKDKARRITEITFFVAFAAFFVVLAIMGVGT